MVRSKVGIHGSVVREVESTDILRDESVRHLQNFGVEKVLKHRLYNHTCKTVGTYFLQAFF
jgi:hypothetical protein